MAAFLALGYLAAVNLLSWLLFFVDKRRSVRGDWRIPEKTLISVAVLGGWPAAKLAQRRLRHKTRKQPFGWVLNTVPVIWLGLAGLIAGVYLATG
ncbi:DUF1294 domain-containing protein [Roseivivax sp. CAU 1753]